jgi:hypothetical protein
MMYAGCTMTSGDARDEGGVELFGAYNTIDVVLATGVQDRSERDMMEIQ